MAQHFRNVCEDHGIVVSSCRCPGPAVPTVVPCPDTQFHRDAVAQSDSQVFSTKTLQDADAIFSLRARLGAELRQAMQEEEVAKNIYAAPHSSRDDLVSFHRSQGRTSGIAMCIEIMEGLR